MTNLKKLSPKNRASRGLKSIVERVQHKFLTCCKNTSKTPRKGPTQIPDMLKNTSKTPRKGPTQIPDMAGDLGQRHGRTHQPRIPRSFIFLRCPIFRSTRHTVRPDVSEKHLLWQNRLVLPARLPFMCRVVPRTMSACLTCRSPECPP